MKIINGGVCAAKGFKASGIHCGIRANKTKKDLALIVSECPASAAAVYTTNLVKGAPLTVTKKHLENLGFVVGGEISVISENDGDLIVSVKESRVAVSREMAEKIMV